MNRLFISTKEAYIPSAEVLNAQFIRTKPHVELFGPENGGEGRLGTIQTSSPEEALWFVKSIFVNLDVKEQLIMDYTQKKVIHVKSVSIPLAQIPQEEELTTQEVHSSITHLELEEK